ARPRTRTRTPPAPPPPKPRPGRAPLLRPRFPDPRRGGAPRRLAQEPGSARSEPFGNVLRRGRERVVHLARIALGLEQPDGGELRRGISRRGGDGIDPGRGRGARLEPVLEDLCQTAERERAGGARAGPGPLPQPRLGAP